MRSIITLVNPRDIVGSIVPKKVGGMWISRIRLEVKEGTKKEEIDKYYYDAAGYRTEELKINNLAVTKISGFNRRFETGTSTVLVERNGLLYKLSNDFPGLGHGNAFFDQILSTFRFD